MIAIIAAVGASLVLLLALVRLFAGPTLYDRTLAASGAAQKAALICAALAVAAGRSDWLDAAFALVLSVFVFNAIVLKFFRSRTFQAPLERVAMSEERAP
jgi:multicomponent Na+:H+ antiporter subunit F